MESDDLFFSGELYKNHLTSIDGVNFTSREIDVIACLLNIQRTKKIAALLSISPHTVLTYDRNIKLKLGCSSQQDIIDFIEKSHKLPLIKQHYVNLVRNSVFEKILKNISNLNKKEFRSCLMIYEKNQADKNELMHHLENHLKQAGFSGVCKEAENVKIESVRGNPQPLFLILEKSDRKGIPQELLDVVDIVDISKQPNYYLAVVETLTILLPNIKVNDLFTNFIEQREGMEDLSGNQSFSNHENEARAEERREMIHKHIEVLKHKKWHVLLFIFGIILFFLAFQIIKEPKEAQIAQSQEEKEPSLRSDLSLPTQFALLYRPEEMAQIDERFKEENGIQTIALVGPGGAGKTILSRQYARQQKAKAIWEINAETYETLKSSFDDLAQALAQTENDQKILTGLQDINDSKEREKKLIGFVKKRIRAFSDWLLIYDNVGEFQEIQKFFPQDAETWGRGKIILTTQNSNIQNSKYVDGIIQIGELNPEQKLILFMEIMTNGDPQLFTATQRKETAQFLEKIPPYPLDISIAAYYLKTANISFDAYLDKLNENSKYFTYVQEKILKGTGDYTKTRYGIIALTLKQLMEINSDFGDLLLFMSLLSSRPIPRDLLDSYKNSVLVDDFICSLKKYSLVTDQKPPPSSVGQSFSMHPSTQDVSLLYLTKALNLHKNKQLLQTISATLENYAADAIDNDDLERVKLLIAHCEWFLKHPQLLDKKEKEAIGGELGGLYFYVKNYPKAQQILEKNLHKGTIDSASIFVYLGLVYKDLAEHKKAKDLFEKSLALYKQKDPENHLRIAQIIGYLGSLEGSLGNYEKARVLLEQSLLMHKQYNQHAPLQRARVQISLGNLYRELSEYEKAKELLEDSILIYKKYTPENHIRTAWALATLGSVYRSLGQYDKAKDLQEESLAMYKKNYPDNHVSVAWISAHLGNTYRKLGQYGKAKDLLEKSYSIYTTYFNDNHSSNAWVLTHLGNLYKELGDDVKAKEALEKGYRIYRAHNLGTLWSGAQLGNFYREQGQLEKAKELLEKSYATYQEHPAEKDIRLAMLLKYLGNLARDSGDYEKAKASLKKSQVLYTEICGQNHIEAARVVHDLGKTYLLEGDLKAAESLLKNALIIVETTQYPDVYRLLETLADLESKKAVLEESAGNTRQAQTHKAQTTAYLKKALGVAKTYLPEGSAHIKRIESKL